MEKAVWKLSPQLWNADLESSAIFLTFAHQIILTHMSYPICFVSLGPGDPELITLKGLKKLRQADIIYCHKQKRTTTLPCGPYYRRTGNREVCSPVLHAPDEQRPDQSLESLRYLV
jgi:hypothetical protein